jgi:hypothetical protein
VCASLPSIPVVIKPSPTVVMLIRSAIATIRA